MEPKAVPPGLVARHDWGVREKPEAELGLAFLISLMTKVVRRAGTVRILGGWPAPTVKAIFQVVQPSSKAT
jgi:hypothetical protein